MRRETVTLSRRRLAIPNLVLPLAVFSVPFAVVSAWLQRRWTLALPSLLWGGLATLQVLGLVDIYAGSIALVAGTLVASATVFDVVGLLLGRNRRRRLTA